MLHKICECSLSAVAGRSAAPCRYAPDSAVDRGELTRMVPFEAVEGSLEAALRQALERAGGTTLAPVHV